MFIYLNLLYNSYLGPDKLNKISVAFNKIVNNENISSRRNQDFACNTHVGTIFRRFFTERKWNCSASDHDGVRMEIPAYKIYFFALRIAKEKKKKKQRWQQ